MTRKVTQWHVAPEMGMHSTRRGFLRRATAIFGAALGRGVAVLFPPRSMTDAGSTVRAAGVADLQRATLTHGPFVGHVTPHSAMVWARCASPGLHALSAAETDGGDARTTSTASATPSDDLCVVWHLTGLQPGRTYAYELSQGGQPRPIGEDTHFVTPPEEDTPAVARIALGSCAREDSGSAGVWRRMMAHDPHVVVLLGDTPYIDSTDLDVQRMRYREFAAVPDFAALARTRPLYATWDDHDFGANDTDGRLPGKANSRQAFVEYHANPSYGEREEGVYTSFRHCGVEVFLLDTRYFAGTEPSPVAEGRPTLLGRRQWDWLRRDLRASTAPFKLLASGMIWNGAVRPGKPDHWETYAYEREALFRFLGEESISGVVLVGGDIHRTRVLRYDTTETAGYRLTELVTSPMHDGVIDDANVPHPALVHDSGEPHSFLLLTVDTTVSPPTLRAQFLNSAGRELYELTLDTSMLTAL